MWFERLISVYRILSKPFLFPPYNSLKAKFIAYTVLLFIACKTDGYKLTWGSAKQRQQLITVLQTALGVLKQSLLVSGKR